MKRNQRRERNNF